MASIDLPFRIATHTLRLPQQSTTTVNLYAKVMQLATWPSKSMIVAVMRLLKRAVCMVETEHYSIPGDLAPPTRLAAHILVLGHYSLG